VAHSPHPRLVELNTQPRQRIRQQGLDFAGQTRFKKKSRKCVLRSTRSCAHRGVDETLRPWSILTARADRPTLRISGVFDHEVRLSAGPVSVGHRECRLSGAVVRPGIRVSDEGESPVGGWRRGRSSSPAATGEPPGTDSAGVVFSIRTGTTAVSQWRPGSPSSGRTADASRLSGSPTDSTPSTDHPEGAAGQCRSAAGSPTADHLSPHAGTQGGHRSAAGDSCSAGGRGWAETGPQRWQDTAEPEDQSGPAGHQATPDCGRDEPQAPNGSSGWPADHSACHDWGCLRIDGEAPHPRQATDSD